MEPWLPNPGFFLPPKSSPPPSRDDRVPTPREPCFGPDGEVGGTDGGLGAPTRGAGEVFLDGGTTPGRDMTAVTPPRTLQSRRERFVAETLKDLSRGCGPRLVGWRPPVPVRPDGAVSVRGVHHGRVRPSRDGCGSDRDAPPAASAFTDAQPPHPGPEGSREARGRTLGATHSGHRSGSEATPADPGPGRRRRCGRPAAAFTDLPVPGDAACGRLPRLPGL